MSDKIRGKCLIRRKGNVFILCGVFQASKELLDSIHDNDEMWAVEFEETQSIKFENVKNHQFSPEDFLENVDNIQSPKMWSRK